MGLLSRTMLTKSAGWRPALQYGLAGAGAAGFMDVAAHGRGRTWGEYKEGLKSPGIGRISNTLLNTLIGVGAANRFKAMGPRMVKGVAKEGDPNAFYQGLAALFGMPGKDVLLGSIGPVEELPGFMDRLSRSTGAQKATAGAALAALPLAYYGGRKLMQNQNDLLREMSSGNTRRQGGTIKVALPPARPGFPPTLVELPVEDVNLSRSLTDKLGRDVRRKLRDGVEARTYIRDPETHDLIESAPWLASGA